MVGSQEEVGVLGADMGRGTKMGLGVTQSPEGPNPNDPADQKRLEP